MPYSQAPVESFVLLLPHPEDQARQTEFWDTYHSLQTSLNLASDGDGNQVVMFDLATNKAIKTIKGINFPPSSKKGFRLKLFDASSPPSTRSASSTSVAVSNWTGSQFTEASMFRPSM